MKKLTVVVFEDELEFKKCSNRVCEKFSNLPKKEEFCGIWGEIKFNTSEVLSAISTTVNHFIEDTDKVEIIFGCCKKDYDDIISKIHTQDCAVNVVLCNIL